MADAEVVTSELRELAKPVPKSRNTTGNSKETLSNRSNSKVKGLNITVNKPRFGFRTKQLILIPFLHL
jgi:hypothetical protein